MWDFEEKIAQRFHEVYTNLGPSYPGYDKLEYNRDLMIATVEKLLKEGVIKPGRFFRYIRGGDIGGKTRDGEGKDSGVEGS